MLTATRFLASGSSRISTLGTSIRHAHRITESSKPAGISSTAEGELPSSSATPATRVSRRHSEQSRIPRRRDFRDVDHEQDSAEPSESFRATEIVDDAGLSQYSSRRAGRFRGPGFDPFQTSKDGVQTAAHFFEETRENRGRIPISRSKFKNPLAKQSVIRPAVQSARVKELAEAGNLDGAVTLIIEAPRHTVNTATWNTLLKVHMAAGKRKQAYKLYIEMKRRAIDFSGATFLTMLSGFSSIDDWSKETLNLTRALKVYEDFEVYRQKCKDDEKNIEPLNRISNSFISLLGKAGQFQKAADIYFAMDEMGRCAPDSFTYTALFDALLRRKNTDRRSQLTLDEQNASDAKLFWRRLEKDVERGNIVIDAFVLERALKLLARGRPADHQLGLEIVHSYCGLASPGEKAPPLKFDMEPHLFTAILELCNNAKKYRLCTSFFKQVMDMRRKKHPRTDKIRLNRFMINQQLLAMGQLAAVAPLEDSARAVNILREWFEQKQSYFSEPLDDKQPILANDTINLALNVCWRCADWTGALEVFSLMTRVPMEKLTGTEDLDQEAYNWGASRVYYTAYSYMARTALLTNNKDSIRQFLRLVSTYKPHSGVGERVEPHTAYHRVQYSSAVLKMLEIVKDSENLTDREKREWSRLKRECVDTVTKSKGKIEKHSPEEEDNIFGSAKYVNKLTQAIDFEMATRSYSS